MTKAVAYECPSCFASLDDNPLADRFGHDICPECGRVVDKRITRTVELRRAGVKYREIAKLLNVSAATVNRWLNPRTAERQRFSSREAKRRRKTPCPDCGTLVSYDRAGGRCGPCKRSALYDARNAKLRLLWEQGYPGKEIAEQMDLTPEFVNSWTTNERARGYELSFRSLPHSDWERRWTWIQKRLQDGWTEQQIADELGTTQPSIANMIYRMKRKGWKV